MSYEIVGYGAMIADRTRTDAYANALRASIDPDSIVVDIGTGSGILSLLACSYGAKYVYAIEPDPVILLARELAKANGFENRITFIQDVSSNVTLPVQADVIVSDLHGLLPYHDQHIPAIIDARKRFLRPGGTMIPLRDRVWAALVEAPNLYASLSEPWRTGGYGLRLDAGVRHALNAITATRFKTEKALAQPALLDTLDFAELTSPNLEARITFDIECDGTAHGIAIWFDADLAQGISFSNNPWGQPLVYGVGFLPLLEPIHLTAAARVAVRVRADLFRNTYLWSWGADRETESDNQIVEYAQSTLLQSLPPITSLLGESQ